MRPAFLLFLTLLLAHCNQRKAEDAILPKEKMVSVLWDVLQVDEFSTEFLEKDSVKKNVDAKRLELYQQVFHIHKISEKDFAASFKYYSDQPDIMKVIFDSLAARGDRERKNVYTRGSGRPKTDSLRMTRADSLRAIKADSLSASQKDSFGKKEVDSLIKRKFRTGRKPGADSFRKRGAASFRKPGS